MLNVFLKEEVVNAVCVVTRYFGGILLGAGGLTRAYGGTAKLALDAAGIPHIKLGVDQQMRDFGQASTAIQAFADVL